MISRDSSQLVSENLDALRGFVRLEAPELPPVATDQSQKLLLSIVHHEFGTIQRSHFWDHWTT